MLFKLLNDQERWLLWKQESNLQYVYTMDDSVIWRFIILIGNS